MSEADSDGNSAISNHSQYSENEDELLAGLCRYDSGNDTDYQLSDSTGESSDESTAGGTRNNSSEDENVSITESELLDIVRDVDEKPRNKRRKSDSNYKKDLYQNETELKPMSDELVWTSLLVRQTQPLDFCPPDNPGLKNIESDDNPCDIFLKLMKPTLELILKYSNDKRIELKEQKKKKYPELDWKDILAFVTAILWMGTKRLPRFHEYYSNDPDLQDAFLIRLRKNNGLSRNKFRSIFTTCRLYDKQKCSKDGLSDNKSPNFDPQHKYRSVIDEFTRTSQKYFNPMRENSIDESMDAFKVKIFFFKL